MSGHYTYLSNPKHTKKRFMNSIRVFYKLFLGLLLLLASSTYSYGAVSAGYSEYYIPGNEVNMWTIFNTLDSAGTNTTMHAVISVTAWSDNTILYYDHWEDGYDFDPDDPAATADERVVLASTGDQYTFESADIPTAPRGTNTYYDGGDYIYVAGGAVTVTRASWVQAVGVGNQSAAWEIYPVKPQLTTYVLPFGENLGFTDFNRVFVLIQATEDNTTFQVDLDGNGTFDLLNSNRNATKSVPDGDLTTITLDRGDVFLLDRISACTSGVTCTTAPGNLNSGAVIKGSATLQVKFVAGNPSQTYCARGLSAFPRGFWTTDYYAPLDDPTNYNTDYYLYNPNPSSLTVNWESLTSSGSFSIPANSTVSYLTEVGAVPANSGLYFKADDDFWGVGINNAGGATYEWGFSLLPSTMLYQEHFLGWAPGSLPLDPTGNPGGQNDDGVFLVAAQDNTRVFVDFDNDGYADMIDADQDGTPESDYVTLNRLQTQFFYDPNDGDMSKAHFWATGVFTMAYGENSDGASTSTPSLDLGYVAIPGSDFISLVLTVDKSVDSEVVATASGSQSVFTLKVNSQKYTLDDILVLDMLPANWEYLGPTSITLPDMTTLTTAPTVTAAGAALPAPFSGNCPAGGGACLTWDNAVLGNMAENQEILITFTAQTTAVLAAGTLSQNRMKAAGTRTAGSETQTFTATDFIYVVSGEMTVEKTSSATNPVYPGDQFTYTVTATNPASATTNLTGVAIYDPMPAGVSYVAGSGSVTCDLPENVRDEFTTQVYTRNDGSENWAGNWTETDSLGGGAASGLVLVTGGQLRFQPVVPATNTANDPFTTDNTYNGGTGWAGPWTEENDGTNTYNTGTIQLSNGNNRVEFTQSQTGDAILRSVTVTGATGAIINFSLTDGGFDAGETIIAEYRLDSGSYVNIGTLDGGAGWTWGAGGAVPLTIALSGNTTLTLRFRVGTNWSAASDHVYLDNVNIGYGVTTAAAGSMIQRTADLTGASSPVLSFTYSSTGLTASDTVVVQASSTGTGGWNTLATFTGGTPDVAQPYDLTTYLSANTTIRFNVTGGINVFGQTFNIDNVDITYYAPSTFASSSSPNFLSSGTGCVIAIGNSITLTYDVIVDDPLDAGIEEITNTAYINSNEIILPLSASVTNIVSNPSSGSSEVGDRVWLDSDGDGVLDVGEPGLANVEVTLKDEFGTPIMTTLTDGTGHYLFTGVTPGNDYYVEVTSSTLPTGLVQSAPSGHTDNRTDPFDLIVSEGNNRDEFGSANYNNSDGTISWTANPWVETDGGGGGAAGGEIRITGGELRINDDTGGTPNSILRPLSVSTDATMATLSFSWRTTDVETDDSIILDISPDGSSYTTMDTFTNLAPTSSGSWSMDISSYLAAGTTIRFRVANGYTGSTDYFFVENVNVEYYSVLNNYLDADLGYAPPSGTATFGDQVWVDADADGVRDAGEVGLGGVTIQLYRDNNGDGVIDGGDTLVDTQITAPDGTYLFTGATAGGGEDYLVSATTPAGYLPTGATQFRYLDAAGGTAYLNADFGYRGDTVTTYTIKDRVWTDTNGDGVFDAGENGIAGVTIELLDASLNVIGTTSTAADGTFIFSGMVGSGADYTVRINDTGGVLTDYYGTTSYAVALKRAESNLTVSIDRVATPPPSYGFRPLRSIGDTVFNDMGGTDGVQDAGEPGMAGVVVSLYSDLNNDGLIAGETLLGSVTTDANGQYLFSGLVDANYIVSVPISSGYSFIPNGVVNPDTDVTAAGIQNKAAMVGGVNVLNKDFGFRAATPRSVSGTIWDDDNADGAIGGAEAHLSGVTIDLLRWSTVIASATSAADGSYSFSGLASSETTGPGTVAATNGSTAVVGTGTSFTTTLVAGQPITINGVGYTIASITDNTHLTLTANYAGGTAGGLAYSATSYTVLVTDINSVLTDYDPTFEYDVGITGPFDNQSPVDLTGGDISNVNFGFKEPTPTLAVISSFEAYEENGRVVVQWETASEIGTAGFYLFRKDDPKGEYIQINEKLLPGLLISHQGGTYRYVDETAMPGNTYTYKLVEVETRGNHRIHGPFTVTAGKQEIASSNQEPMSSSYSRKAHDISDAKKSRINAGKLARKAIRTSSVNGKVKITMTENGLYYLDASEIASLKGTTTAKIQMMITNNQLLLTNHGQNVACLSSSDNSGIYFYGQGINSIYTRENIYWLEKGSGLQMEIIGGAGPDPAGGNETFTKTFHFEEDHWAATAMFDDPQSDYWLWDYIVAGDSGLGSKTFNIKANGVASSSESATLSVHLQGDTNTSANPDHHVVVSLNGTTLVPSVPESDRWDGQEPHSVTYDIDQSIEDLLLEGGNIVVVKGLLDTGAPYSVFYVDSFDLNYHRYYKAINNRLFVKGDSNQVITIDSFTNPDIFVFDISNPKKPKLINAITVDHPGVDNYRVSFRPDSPEYLYLALTIDGLSTPVSLIVDKASNLKESGNRVNYLIITPEELKDASQALADYRQSQGLKTMVVELEDIMDEFNYGIYSPEAIRDFLSYAYYNWIKAPRYVVLAGEGTFDYKDNMGYGGNLIPPIMIGTPQGLFPSDNHYADIDGDHIPEMAIGRLPVVTPKELTDIIVKTIAYENSKGGTWTKQVLMLADNPDDGGDFPVDSNNMAALLPPEYTVNKIYLSEHPIGEARQMVLYGINNGAFLLNYIGHGGLDRLAQEGMLLNSDVASMTNTDRLPVVTAMTCVVGNFSYPGFDSLSEVLLLKQNGGAVAVWSPTGMSINSEAVILNEAFFKSTFAGTKQALGDAVFKALKRGSMNGVSGYILDIYNLTGDPALKLK